MSLTLKPVNVWALVLGAVALLSAGTCIVHGVRVGLHPMLIVGVVGTIFIVLVLVYSLLGPLYSDRELRYALFSLVFENCFFVGGVFALAADRFKTATLAVVAGVTVHFLVTRKRFSRLRRHRRDGAPLTP